MKKLQLCILGSLFAASLQAQSTDYTKGLSIWFDTPNNLDGRASWYSPVTDKAWENNSLPIGNGSLGGNVMGSIAAERITLNEKTLWRGGPNTEKGAAYYWNVNKESGQIRKQFQLHECMVRQREDGLYPGKCHIQCSEVYSPKWRYTHFCL